MIWGQTSCEHCVGTQTGRKGQGCEALLLCGCWIEEDPAPRLGRPCPPPTESAAHQSIFGTPAGGTRFIGVYLARQLVEEGHDVTLLTRGKAPVTFQIPDDTDASFKQYADSIKHIAADRKDEAALKDKLSGAGFEGMLFPEKGLLARGPLLCPKIVVILLVMQILPAAKTSGSPGAIFSARILLKV